MAAGVLPAAGILTGRVVVFVSRRAGGGENVQALFWSGLVVLILGLTSIFVPIPSTEKNGLTVGSVSIDIETQSNEKLSPIISAAMVLGGAGLMIAAKKKS